ncbi:MAG: TRAP transporter substrate-binding protein [Ectothiorhodospiraceae bacterium]|nr:TRAP transporter substrate-binding protein [Ectothiorhodospiraceae bacterium]
MFKFKNPVRAMGIATVICTGTFAVLMGPMKSASADEVESLHMRITNSYLQDMASGVALDHFAKRVEELSAGAMTVEVYHGGTLYSEGASVDGVLDGTVQMGLASTANHGPFTDVWRVIEAPYLFESREAFREVIIRGEIGDELREMMRDDGLYPLMILETGGFRILGTQREVRVPGDLRGQRIRVPGSRIPLTFWEEAGASTASVAWSETYLALGQGAVDGLDAAWTSWYLGSLWDVTEYITPVHYSVVASLTPVSQEWWEQRSAAQQEILLQAAREAEEISMEEEISWDQRLREMVVDNGVTIVELTPEEMDQWQELGRSLWGELNLPMDQLDRIQAEIDAL